MKPTILYEDENILAIDKPTGLVVHGDGKNSSPSLADWIIEKYPVIKDVGEPGRDSEGNTIYRPGIVHRLDRETSGVMLIAKNQMSFEFLKKQFQEHKIKKIYHAFVIGEMKKDKDVIDRPIGRSNKDFRMWSAQRGARGELRDAVTEYKVVNRNKGYSFVEIMPKTGRTHQIRVHFKAISYPLVGDPMYSPTTENTLGFQRLALHAKSIEFVDMSNKKLVIEAPYPKDFIQALNSLQN